MSTPTDDLDLQEQLRALGRDLAAVETPDLRSGVRSRIAITDGGSTRRRGRRATIAAIALAATIGATGVAAAASPSLRTELRHLFDFDGVQFSVSTTPPAPGPAPHGADLQMGSRVTLAEAQQAAGFRIALPQRVGEPGQALLLRSAAGPIVTVVYPSGPTLPRSRVTGDGAILTEYRGSIDRIVFRKVLAGIDGTRRTSVNGTPAIFAGGPQRLFVVASDVDPYGLTPRPSSNALIWSTGGIAYRLEAQLPLHRLLTIAETIH
jgi:hypothetical protein